MKSGTFAPDVSFRQQLGEDSTTAGQEPLLISVISRILGKSHLDSILAHGFPENSRCRKVRRWLLVYAVRYANLTRRDFFALAWKAPLEVDRAYRDRMAEMFAKELQILLVALPDRFHPIIRGMLASLPSIFSLPMVLLHKDFRDCNIMVESSSYLLASLLGPGWRLARSKQTSIHCKI